MAPPLNLWAASLFATLTSSLFGYTVGLIGGLIVLPSFLRHFGLSSLPPSLLAAAQSQVVTVWLIGALFGVPIGIPVCARWGRRMCLALSAILYVLGAALQLSGASLITFEIGRAINGLGVGVGTLVGPMYISEISPPEYRGMLMSNYQTILQLSALVGFWIAFATNAIFTDDSDLQWQLPVIVQLIPGALLLLGAFVIPETPQFLASKGNWSGVADSLAWLRKLPRDDDDISDEVLEVKEAARFSQAMQKRHNVSFFKEAMKKPIRKRLGVGIGLMIAQNMVGLNALNYYAPVIFMSAGFPTVSARLFLTGVFGLVKVVAAVAFMFVFVRMRGNRFWLKLGSAICGISMLVLAYFVRELNNSHKSPDSHAGPSAGGVISVLMVYVFAFSFGVSLGPISWNVCSEIFPLHISAKCCAITTCTQWLFQIVIASITPRLIASVGWVTYVIYAAACLITFVWVSLAVPETRDVPLGRAMDELFTSPASRAKTSDPDAGAASDEEAAAEEIEDAVDERTALLFRERERDRRRSSFAGLN